MLKNFRRFPYDEIARQLAQVAMGRCPADLIIKNGRLVNVITAQVQPNMDIAVYKGYIALVGDASHVRTDENTRIIDAENRYLMPGLIDSHMHVESSMVDLCSFAAGILPHGTTTICPDNHEMTNVLGLRAVELFKQSSEGLPLKVLTAMPVCVPSLPGFEDAGATIGPIEVRTGYENGWAELQGEQMNFPGVIFGDSRVHDITAEGIRANRVLTGHYAGEDLNAGLNAFIASGMTACHESTDAKGALKRAQLGMYVQQRYGSAWLDLPNLIPAITDNPGIDTRFFTLVTDDVTPATIRDEGHLIRVLRKAVSLGISPVQAIQMVTINPAQLLEKSRWIGSITPGRSADILLVDDLQTFHVHRVISDGIPVARNGKLTVEIGHHDYPDWALNTVHMPPLRQTDFSIPVPDNTPRTVRVIGMVPGMVYTRSQTAVLVPESGVIGACPAQDIAKVGMFFRHTRQDILPLVSPGESNSGDPKSDGSKALGFVSGTGMKPGAAYASTIAHDCHNLLVVGTDDKAMALAANTIIESKGGIAVVVDNKVAGHIALPLAGLMGLDSIEQTADQLTLVEAALKRAGCVHPSMEMTLSLLGLVVLGELHISNQGLVELKENKPPCRVDLIL
ncbi:AdeC [Desulforapulum autotrophicum HRM2]|uniref:Adenine deaminase n=1 Tax=Desulforapulum autotrophicum (strain ATCC 43914 / DSM 3382 / VKM B-1955 / HRM2) TaxID=177437 RepID=C0QFY8_DESAH|nr:adenine deaminase C-terminal domain-containing protein [Desulforapulum autotrophicum]ACN15556.1 AdeC [Desulforapulum autotrophicum HRM2]